MKKQARKPQTKTHSVRIIGGLWRSHKIYFDSHGDIRPTPDAVRETLFNWLAPYIDRATCLDLYAGSGALGFEAASRGAAKVIMVENHRPTTTQLKLNKEKLQATMVEIINTHAENFLRNTQSRFDILFLDPPFQHGIVESVSPIIQKNKILHAPALIYVEAEKQLDPLPIPTEWHIIRQHVQGAVAYYLISTRE